MPQYTYPKPPRLSPEAYLARVKERRELADVHPVHVPAPVVREAVR